VLPVASKPSATRPRSGNQAIALDIHPRQPDPLIGVQEPEVGRVEAFPGQVGMVVVTMCVIDPDPSLRSVHPLSTDRFRALFRVVRVF